MNLYTKGFLLKSSDTPSATPNYRKSKKFKCTLHSGTEIFQGTQLLQRSHNVPTKQALSSKKNDKSMIGN